YLDERRADFHSGLGRRLAKRGHAQVEHLDAEPDRQAALMFYIHGGGYSFGSSYELPSHEGAQMVRHHDVVQVSVNHRLNILGFFDVSKIGGSAYDDSANVGMTDLVVALE